MPDTSDARASEAEIRSVVEGWAVWRDAGRWEELRATWHPDGRMHSTWFRGGVDDFVDAARRAFDAGVVVHHFLGGTAVDLRGDRAIAQTKMTISQRLVVHDVLVDVTCTGRFYDFFERRDTGWRIVLRDPIYEKDRIDPVEAGEVPAIDPIALASYPEGCRHLLYCQSLAGLTVHRDVPGTRGLEIEALYARGDEWLRSGDHEMR